MSRIGADIAILHNLEELAPYHQPNSRIKTPLESLPEVTIVPNPLSFSARHCK